MGITYQGRENYCHRDVHFHYLILDTESLKLWWEEQHSEKEMVLPPYLLKLLNLFFPQASLWKMWVMFQALYILIFIYTNLTVM